MLDLDRDTMCDWNNLYRQRSPLDGGLRNNRQVIESVI